MPTFATPWDIYMDFINDLEKQNVLWTSLLTASADYANSSEGKVQVQEVLRTMVNTYAKCPPSQAHTTILSTEQNRAICICILKMVIILFKYIFIIFFNQFYSFGCIIMSIVPVVS